jgi:hypothetical protein
LPVDVTLRADGGYTVTVDTKLIGTYKHEKQELDFEEFKTAFESEFFSRLETTTTEEVSTKLQTSWSQDHLVAKQTTPVARVHRCHRAEIRCQRNREAALVAGWLRGDPCDDHRMRYVGRPCRRLPSQWSARRQRTDPSRKLDASQDLHVLEILGSSGFQVGGRIEIQAAAAE